MVVVEVLAYECVRLAGPVDVHLGHVEVVDEVDESLGGRGGVVAAGLLLQGLLQHSWGAVGSIPRAGEEEIRMIDVPHSCHFRMGNTKV